MRRLQRSLSQASLLRKRQLPGQHVLDHYDHVAKLIGPEHLGVGSDMDLYGYDAMPAELNKKLRAGYKGSYAFREKLDIEGLNHPRRSSTSPKDLSVVGMVTQIYEAYSAEISHAFSRRYGL